MKNHWMEVNGRKKIDWQITIDGVCAGMRTKEHNWDLALSEIGRDSEQSPALMRLNYTTEVKIRSRIKPTLSVEMKTQSAERYFTYKN